MTLEEVYRDKDFLKALNGIEAPGIGAAKVAEIMDCSHEGAKGRMKKLVRKGLVKEDKVPACGQFGFMYVWLLAGPLEDMLKKLSEIEEQEAREIEDKERARKEKRRATVTKKKDKSREDIYKTLNEKKSVSINDIMKSTGYSYYTILRHLQALEGEGKVKRYKETNKWLKKVSGKEQEKSVCEQN
jgi:predicted ArsR family transcriptional regulator